jgi:serine phosphatase RsbU (regulator of sigma subunit)
MKISKVLDYFIHKEYLENLELYRKSQFIVWLLFLFILLNPLFAISSAGIDSKIIFYVSPLFEILLISLLFLFKKRGSFVLVTHAICGIFTLTMFFLPRETGGLFSPDMSSLYIFPIFALIMGGIKIGLFYASVNVIIMIIYYYLALINTPFYLGSLENISNEYFFTNLLMNFLIIIFLVFRNEKIRQKLLSEVTEKNTLITQKNKEIQDSIQYAKRIQKAILPPKELVNDYLPNSFILYKPKDIVAGDFYWMQKISEKILFAAADCTGHGIPGALVSVICNDGLNQSVEEHKLIDPGKILDKTRDIIIHVFEKSEEEVKDGMDISLCVLDKKENTLQWSGANNPIWIVRDGKIQETKPDKQAIGKTDNPKPFKTHNFELNMGDLIYIFTDGFQDQFGGDKGKKFKLANFKKLLLSIHNEKMEKQLKIINNSFEEWRGNQEQVDDICIIGVRI